MGATISGLEATHEMDPSVPVHRPQPEASCYCLYWYYVRECNSGTLLHNSSSEIFILTDFEFKFHLPHLFFPHLPHFYSVLEIHIIDLSDGKWICFIFRWTCSGKKKVWRHVSTCLGSSQGNYQFSPRFSANTFPPTLIFFFFISNLKLLISQTKLPDVTHLIVV